MSTNKRNRKENICNGIGINDMPFNWFSETDESKKIYYLWSGMINRCYNENPDEYYKKIGKRAKQYKGYTYYYNRGDE